MNRHNVLCVLDDIVNYRVRAVIPYTGKLLRFLRFFALLQIFYDELVRYVAIDILIKEAATAKIFPVNVHFLFQPQKFCRIRLRQTYFRYF